MTVLSHTGCLCHWWGRGSGTGGHPECWQLRKAGYVAWEHIFSTHVLDENTEATNLELQIGAFWTIKSSKVHWHLFRNWQGSGQWEEVLEKCELSTWHFFPCTWAADFPCFFAILRMTMSSNNSAPSLERHSKACRVSRIVNTKVYRINFSLRLKI